MFQEIILGKVKEKADLLKWEMSFCVLKQYIVVSTVSQA